MVQTPKTFQAIHIHFEKVKKPTYEFCTHLFFASEMILIFGGLFLYRLSRILKLKLNWIRVTTNELARERLRTRRENTNSSNISWKARKKPPKGHTKNRPFVFCTVSKDRI